MKKNSLFFRTLLAIFIFIIFALLFLYFFQIQFLDYYYEKHQIDTISRISKDLKKNNLENIDKYLEDNAYSNDICIKYVTEDDEFSYNTKKFGCILDFDKTHLNEYINNLKNNDLDYIKLVGKNDIKSILYLVPLNDERYVLLNANLESLNVATDLLKDQLLYIVLLFFSIGIIFSFFLSKTITKPILKIINSARELEKGNFDVKFDGGNVAELCELADILTVSAVEMKNIDDLRKDLIANVSHDLKTPLTMIKAYAEKVRDLSYKDKEKREKDLNVIIEESERLNGLVNDLLALSKLESGTSKLEIEEYNLIDQIKDVLKRYEILEEQKNYHIELNIPNERIIIKADRNRMDQVFYNLINNAIEHTGKDNRVIISVRTRPHHYTISIQDTGNGISKEEMPLVWNKYYTKKKNHKRNIVGTGLGLSIVKTILERHNFEYGIDSKLNEYTRFYFRIRKSK
jgi:signal transduction histidine kinase